MGTYVELLKADGATIRDDRKNLKTCRTVVSVRWDDCILANAYKDATLIVKPVTTAEFLEINPDDIVLYWQNDGEICFSDSLLEWFKELKDRFDQLLR